jgi:hypothetical protein
MGVLPQEIGGREGDISRKISGMSGKGKTYAVHAALLSIHKPTGQQIH